MSRESIDRTPPAAAPTRPPAARPNLPPGNGRAPAAKAAPGPSKTETIKETSDGLRGNLAAALRDGSDHFEEVEKQLLKFHGSYQQDDRDARKGEKLYSFMVRSKLPGGQLTAEQYLVHDRLADDFANGTLRITTREGFQFHGVVKGDLKETIRSLNAALVTTLGACGDVVRNVICCPVPARDALTRQIHDFTHRITDHFFPRSGAYHEIWLDGEQLYDGRQHAARIEPIYGKTYLPRKFKIGIAFPGDNCIDVYAQDVGLIPIVEDEALAGYNVLVGGGLGMTHRKAETFPRLADPLAYVPRDRALDVLEQIVCIQRDYGDRSDRKHARLKYLVHEWGLPRFRAELERRLGYPLADPAPVPPFTLELHLGWHRQPDGRWTLGLSVENGRIRDDGDLRLKTALREAVSRFRPNVALTANQDLLLTDVREEDRAGIEALLRAHGVPMAEELSNAQKYSMACPALPTCPLAITEAERALPGVIDEVEDVLAELGLQDEPITIRMTGCPNGCARPYVADVGLVGRSLDRYSIFLGGRPDGTRLNELYQDLVPLDEIASTLRPLFALFRRDRLPGECFGDFTRRAGHEALLAYANRFEEDEILG